MTPTAIWHLAAGLAARRPVPFLLFSLLLAGTDLMLWQTGVYDGGAEQSGAGAKAAFLVGKSSALLVWALLALRLIGAPDRTPGAALRLNRRQAGWIAGVLPVMLLLFGLRLALTRLFQFVLPDTRMALIAGLILYLILSLILLVRLLPAWIGVLLDDRQATLAWSWRATRGRVVSSVLLVILAIAPVGAFHVGLNLFWMAEAPAFRAAILVADGAVMALFVAISVASYRALYLQAKAR